LVASRGVWAAPASTLQIATRLERLLVSDGRGAAWAARVRRELAVLHESLCSDLCRDALDTTFAEQYPHCRRRGEQLRHERDLFVQELRELIGFFHEAAAAPGARGAALRLLGRIRANRQDEMCLLQGAYSLDIPALD
jgi:hypothetical protein